jgi:hypothetical protein
MSVRAALIGAALAALCVTSVSAEIRIRQDPGGQIGPYINAAARIRDAGERVVVDGPCLSACTLLIAMVPHDRVCVTARAMLGYHAAWVPGHDGRPVTSREGTATLWAAYSPQVRNVLRRKGGLSRKLIVLRGRELASLYRRCR